jgi:hypothetical protein
MDPRQQSAKQFTHALAAVLTRCRRRASEREGAAIEEALRRLKEHERLLRQVLPELRKNKRNRHTFARKLSLSP